LERLRVKARRARGRVDRREAARRRLKAYTLRSVAILGSGVAISLAVLYLGNPGESLSLWASLAVLAAATFFSTVLIVKAYSFYLYVRLVDLLASERLPEVAAPPVASRAGVVARAVESGAVAEAIAPPRVAEERKTCPYCGKELPFGDVHIYCPFCGKKLK